MFQKWKSLYSRYKTVLLYLFFGVCTTLVNMVCYNALYYRLHMENIPSTAAAWLAAVIFAFFTNKVFVFESKQKTTAGWLRELASFFGCRVLTGVLDVAIMAFCVDFMGWNGLLWKFISNVIVTVLNYAASKFFIFKKP